MKFIRASYNSKNNVSKPHPKFDFWALRTFLKKNLKCKYVVNSLPGVDRGVADIDVTAALVVFDDLVADGTTVFMLPPFALEIKQAASISLSFFSLFSFVPRMI